MTQTILFDESLKTVKGRVANLSRLFPKSGNFCVTKLTYPVQLYHRTAVRQHSQVSQNLIHRGKD